MEKEKEELLTITKEVYDSLVEDSAQLSCLEATGVDNWSGYEDAMDLYAQGLDEEEEEDD